MTERHPSPGPEHDRAERAMRSSLRAHADDMDAAPLDPTVLRSRATAPQGGGRSSRRPPVWLAVAAVALVALIIPMGSLLTGSSGANTASSTSEAQVEPAVVAPDATPSDAAGTEEAEFRQVVLLDVVVDVPADWGFGFTPGKDWCEGYDRPAGPFVDRDPLQRRTPSTTCADDVPDSLRQTWLTWRRATPDDQDSVTAVGDWSQVSRSVGSAFITVQVPKGDSALANQILDSARVVVTGPQGCASRIDPGRPNTGELVDLRSVSEVAVCQYDLDGSPGPNLVGSYALYGDDAQAVLDAMLAAPMSARPERTCEAVSEVLVVRFGGGIRQVRIELSPCTRPVLDDGVSYRAPTRPTCGDLITGPLWVASVPEGSDACVPA